MEQKIDVINGLRGWAIVAVIYHHLCYGLTGPGWHAIQLAGFSFSPFTALANGWLGVNLFFMLSGFVLFLPYLTTQRAFSDKNGIFTFYRRRALRLLPLYYISTLLVIALSPLAFGQGDMLQFTQDFVYMMSITFNFSKDLFLPKYNIVLWSLGIEIWFSLLFPFIVLLSYYIGIVKLLIYTLLFSLAVRLMGDYYVVFTIDNPFLNPLKDSVLGRLDDFVVGMFVAYLLAQGRCKALETKAIKLFVLGIMGLLLACTVLDNILLGNLPRSLMPFTNNIIHIGLFLIIIGLLSMPTRQWIKWPFTNYALQLLGMMCYSLYIWHGIVAVFLQHDYSIARLSGYFVLLLGLTLFSYRYIEFGHIRETRALFLAHR